MNSLCFIVFSPINYKFALRFVILSLIFSRMTKDPKKIKSNKILIALIISLLLNGYLLVDKYMQQQKLDKYATEIAETQLSKDSLTTEVSKLYEEYDMLSTNNDTLNAKLKAEQDRVKELLEKVKNLKGANARTIAKYKKELSTLRSVMRSFIVQIDSLNTLNHTLKAENKQIKNKYREAQNEYKELEEKNTSLETTVEKAAEIEASYIRVLGLNKKDKPTNKKRKISKIEVCCRLEKNEIAEKGRRDIYVRIARPDGIILSKSASNLFAYKDENIVYSSKRSVEYTGKRVEVCVYWINDEILIKGRYSIDVYESGRKIASSFIDLK